MDSRTARPAPAAVEAAKSAGSPDQRHHPISNSRVGMIQGFVGRSLGEIQDRLGAIPSA